MDNNELKKVVKEKYGVIARTESTCCGPSASNCCSPEAPGVSMQYGYKSSELNNVPQGADLGLGCGNPTALAFLKDGETVIDLGSGAGLDCFLAAEKVGKSGRVVGVDMTPEMVEKARKNLQKSGYMNVEFRLGEIEHLPVENDTADVIISNCVINLVPDKKRAFGEMFRVLKPGGRLMISDIVLDGELPELVKSSLEAYVGCIAGAERKDRYLEIIGEAGFSDIVIREEHRFVRDDEDLSCLEQSGCVCSDNSGIDYEKFANAVMSISVSAFKPDKTI